MRGRSLDLPRLVASLRLPRPPGGGTCLVNGAQSFGGTSGLSLIPGSRSLGRKLRPPSPPCRVLRSRALLSLARLVPSIVPEQSPRPSPLASTRSTLASPQGESVLPSDGPPMALRRSSDDPPMGLWWTSDSPPVTPSDCLSITPSECNCKLTPASRRRVLSLRKAGPPRDAAHAPRQDPHQPGQVPRRLHERRRGLRRLRGDACKFGR